MMPYELYVVVRTWSRGDGCCDSIWREVGKEIMTFLFQCLCIIIYGIAIICYPHFFIQNKYGWHTSIRGLLSKLGYVTNPFYHITDLGLDEVLVKGLAALWVDDLLDTERHCHSMPPRYLARH